MGFQLGPLAPRPGVQQPHPSPIGGVGCWPGSHGSEEQDASLLPLITLKAGWGKKKKFKNLCLSVGTHQSWSHFFPLRWWGHRAQGGGKAQGFGVWGWRIPHFCCLCGGATCHGCCAVTVHQIYSL